MGLNILLILVMLIWLNIVILISKTIFIILKFFNHFYLSHNMLLIIYIYIYIYSDWTIEPLNQYLVRFNARSDFENLDYHPVTPRARGNWFNFLPQLFRPQCVYISSCNQLTFNRMAYQLCCWHLIGWLTNFTAYYIPIEPLNLWISTLSNSIPGPILRTLITIPSHLGHVEIDSISFPNFFGHDVYTFPHATNSHLIGWLTNFAADI